MSAKNEVNAASSRFYAALNSMANGDAAPMSDVWSHGPGVSTMHPIGGREVGWEEVRVPWEQVAGLAGGGEIRIGQQAIEVAGDLAYEIGVESGHMVLAGEKVQIDHRVTNVYRREGGEWRVVHHHTDLSPAMIEVLGRVGAEG